MVVAMGLERRGDPRADHSRNTHEGRKEGRTMTVLGVLLPDKYPGVTRHMINDVILLVRV